MEGGRRGEREREREEQGSLATFRAKIKQNRHFTWHTSQTRGVHHLMNREGCMIA